MPACSSRIQEQQLGSATNFQLIFISCKTFKKMIYAYNERSCFPILHSKLQFSNRRPGILFFSQLVHLDLMYARYGQAVLVPENYAAVNLSLCSSAPVNKCFSIYLLSPCFFLFRLSSSREFAICLFHVSAFDTPLQLSCLAPIYELKSKYFNTVFLGS